MKNETTFHNQVLTLAINGDLTLDVFVASVKNFVNLTEALAKEISPNEKIVWMLDTLESGSAIMGARPTAENRNTPDRLVQAWAQIGESLQTETPMPYSDIVKKPALELVKLLDKGIPSIVFQTNSKDFPIASRYNPKVGIIQKPRISYGVLKGRVDTLGRRRGVRFTLYDSLFDKPVPCYLPDGKEDMVREFWGRNVIVSGQISRDDDTGKPYAVRNITNIEAAKISEPGSWRKAAGVLNLNGDGPEFLRRSM